MPKKLTTAQRQRIEALERSFLADRERKNRERKICPKCGKPYLERKPMSIRQNDGTIAKSWRYIHSVSVVRLWDYDVPTSHECYERIEVIAPEQRG